MMAPAEPLRRRSSVPLIGEILVRTAGLRPSILEQALETQQEEGGRIGEILVRLKAVTEEQVLQALAEQLDLDYMEDVTPEVFERGLAKRVGRSVRSMIRGVVQSTVESFKANPPA